MPKTPINADPSEVIRAARKAAAAGKGTSEALRLLQEANPVRYAEADGRWLAARLTYYRRNKDLAHLVPTFGAATASTVTLAKDILAAEQAAEGKRLLPDQPLRNVVALVAPVLADEPAAEPATTAEAPVAAPAKAAKGKGK